MDINRIKTYSDQKLLKTLDQIILHEKKTTATLILYLAEVDRRKLFLKEGYASLYSYLIDKYHYEGASAYRRIQAARLLKRFPDMIGYVESNKLTLTALCLISPHMTEKNKTEMIQKVIGKSRQEIEALIAETFGKKLEIQKDKIRMLPQRQKSKAIVLSIQPPSPQNESRKSLEISSSLSVGGENKISHKKEEKPHVERHVKVEFVASEVVAQKLRRAQDLLRHKYPSGRFEDIIHEALELLLEKKDPERQERRIQQRKKMSGRTLFRRKNAPINLNKLNQNKTNQNKKTSTRHISAPIRRQIWQRDNGQCSFKSPNGKHCGERSFLQLDHIKPFALGGKHTVDNLRLLCTQHNRYRSEQTFGQVLRP